jgi:hypothetical protein
VGIVTVAIGVLILTLLIGEERSDHPPSNPWCEGHYQSARSAVESLAVDQMLHVPNPGKRGLANPRFCGDFRLALDQYRQRSRAAKSAQKSP